MNSIYKNYEDAIKDLQTAFSSIAVNAKDIFNKCKEKGVEISFKYFPELNWFRIRITKRDAFNREYIKDYVFCPDDIVEDRYLEEAIDRIIEYVVRISQE